MRRVILRNDRHSSTWYYDVRAGWRMGDYAFVAAYFVYWRQLFPKDRLIFIADTFHPLCFYSNPIPKEWICQQLFDEIWYTDYQDEPIRASGRPVRVDGIVKRGTQQIPSHQWDLWYDYIRQPVRLPPQIRVPSAVADAAKLALDRLQVPERFVVIQPLYDAGYHQYRNAPITWWNTLFEKLSKQVPLVIVTSAVLGAALTAPEGSFPLYRFDLPTFESLGVIQRASTVVGGETGFPLWASNFGVPVVALWRDWFVTCVDAPQCRCDFRPATFTAPVISGAMEGDIDHIVERTKRLFNNEITQSDPLDRDGQPPALMPKPRFDWPPYENLTLHVEHVPSSPAHASTPRVTDKIAYASDLRAMAAPQHVVPVAAAQPPRPPARPPIVQRRAPRMTLKELLRMRNK